MACLACWVMVGCQKSLEQSFFLLRFFFARCRSPKLVICVSTCIRERVIPKPSSTKDSVPNRDFEFGALKEMCNILHKPPAFSQMLRSCIFGMWQCLLQALLSLLTLISQDFTAALWSSRAGAHTEGINYPRLAPRWVLALKGEPNRKGWLELTSTNRIWSPWAKTLPWKCKFLRADKAALIWQLRAGWAQFGQLLPSQVRSTSGFCQGPDCLSVRHPSA